MWPSGVDANINPKPLTALSSSSSSSKSSSSSSSPALHHHYNNPRSRNMEEVWKEINLGSLYDHNSNDSPRVPTPFRGVNFQDFLARPLSSRDPSPASLPSSYPSSSLPPPATMLTLHSGPDLHFLADSDPLIRPGSVLVPPLPHHHHSLPPPFDVLASSSSGLSSNSKKRFPDPDNNASGDRRHKRMIKNRESAARSRARKQESTFSINLYDSGS